MLFLYESIFISAISHTKGVTDSHRSQKLKEFQRTYSVFTHVFDHVVLYMIRSAVFAASYSFSKWKLHV